MHLYSCDLWLIFSIRVHILITVIRIISLSRSFSYWFCLLNSFNKQEVPRWDAFWFRSNRPVIALIEPPVTTSPPPPTPTPPNYPKAEFLPFFHLVLKPACGCCTAGSPAACTGPWRPLPEDRVPSPRSLRRALRQAPVAVYAECCVGAWSQRLSPHPGLHRRQWANGWQHHSDFFRDPWLKPAKFKAEMQQILIVKTVLFLWRLRVLHSGNILINSARQRLLLVGCVWLTVSLSHFKVSKSLLCTLLCHETIWLLAFIYI